MNYDYHYEEGPHVGPLAPLGWVEENLDLIQGLDGGRRAGKFLLGLPNYGLIGPDEGADGQGVVRVCQPSSACRALFQGPYEETTGHMGRCRAPGGQRYAPGRTPNVALGCGERLYFEDLASLDERIAAGVRRGLGGVSYWSIGGEPGGDAFFAMVRERYPAPPP
jgi:spore germination protein YaaH